jgi:hypothetical protein
MSDSPALGTTDTLSRHAALALAVGAVGLPFGAAQAQIVTYTTDQPLSSGTATIQFDGATAFSFDSNADFAAAGSNLVHSLGQTYATKLSSGVTIDATLFNPTSGVTEGVQSGLLGPGVSSSKTAYYIGLLVDNAGTDYYGYAEIGLTGVQPTDIIGYAFETTPGGSIVTAPLSSSIPEPASLALLATGVAGALAIRRRARVPVQ